MIFAFGPKDTYFFDDGNGARRWRVSDQFNAHMSSRQVGSIHAVALGEDGAFFINYTTANGLQHMNEWQDPQSRYHALYTWLFTEDVPHDRKSVSVSLGMRGSFFAASDQGHRWRSIPESLQDYYQKFTRMDLFLKSRVNTVDLGFDGTFLGIGIDNAWFWNLSSQYSELSAMIGQKGINNVDISELFKQYANKAGAHIPPTPNLATPSMGPPPPQRPQPQQTSSSSSGGWRPSWDRRSSNTSHTSGHSSPPVSPPMSPPAQSPGWQPARESRFDWNQAMRTTQSVLDAYNNAQGQTQYGNTFSGSDVFTSGINTLNNVNDGLQLVNSMTSNGVMIGQLAGQFAGTAAACCVM
nr:hypothetical protein CFP56_00654 [Quercus suber]